MAGKSYMDREVCIAQTSSRMHDYLNFNCTAQDLRVPSMSFVKTFYCTVLNELGLNVPSLTQMQSHQSLRFSYPEMYSESTSLRNLFEAIRFHFDAIGIPGFSLEDLFEPEPKRALHFIVEMMDFLEYCDRKVAGLCDTNTVEKFRYERDDYLKKINDYKKQYNAKLIKKDEEAEAAINAESERIGLESDLKEVAVKKEKVKERCEALKSKFNQVKHGTDKLHGIEASVKDAVRMLESRIISSPKKLQYEMERIDAQKKDMEERSRILKEDWDSKKKIVENMCAQVEAQKGRFVILTNICEKGDRHRIEKKQKDSSEVELRKWESKKEATLAEMNEMKEQLVRLGEKMDDMARCSAEEKENLLNEMNDEKKRGAELGEILKKETENVGNAELALEKVAEKYEKERKRCERTEKKYYAKMRIFEKAEAEVMRKAQAYLEYVKKQAI